MYIFNCDMYMYCIYKVMRKYEFLIFCLVFIGFVVIIEFDYRRLFFCDFVCVGYVYGGILNLFVKL